jgi:hypothetical protein
LSVEKKPGFITGLAGVSNNTKSHGKFVTDALIIKPDLKN